jgi:putative DNA primase/helicase
MDLERKGKQSYQGWMYARILAFSNGDLQSLYDRSDGFYRRQLILTAREKPADRMDDPDLADKLCAELPGIFNWAFAGLRRLAAHNFQFTESERVKANRQAVKQDANNVFAFLEAEDYVTYGPGLSASSRDLYNCYCKWCGANAYDAFKQRSFSDILLANLSRYHIVYSNNLLAADGKRVRGFTGIGVKSRGLPAAAVWQEASPEEAAEQENLWPANG